ncbi:MAG: hypothetical protein NC084_06955 [Bacteroides sp.]|nr:hypothetical protein [Eubacterium sp.]MCM1418782.1 hypothetical protein [Roseburia sp.]MCM1462439.1 hypothetical protein [Bacteroides sp.]
MKKRISAFTLSALFLLAAGCGTAETDSGTKAAETAARLLSDTAEAGATNGEGEAEPTEERFYPMRAGEGKKVFEEGKKYLELSVDGVSYDHELLNKPEETDDPTLAERVYRALYDFAVFFQYADPCRLYYLCDQKDAVQREVVSFDRYGGAAIIDKDNARPLCLKYSRVKYGEITTISEYFSRFFQVATMTFYRSDACLFDKQFVLSDGDLYLTDEPESVSYLTEDADSRLNDVRAILDRSRAETLELSFTAYYVTYDPDFPLTEDYIVSLRYDDELGWRVDGCSDERAVGFLIAEILEGGRDHASPKTELLEDIKLWLGQIGLM